MRVEAGVVKHIIIVYIKLKIDINYKNLDSNDTVTI